MNASALQSRPELDPRAVRALSDQLIAAGKRLLITAHMGRNPATVGLIDDIARLAGIRVIEFNMNGIELDTAVSYSSPIFAVRMTVA